MNLIKKSLEKMYILRVSLMGYWYVNKWKKKSQRNDKGEYTGDSAIALDSIGILMSLDGKMLIMGCLKK